MCNLTLNDILSQDVEGISPDTNLKTVLAILSDSEHSCCVITTENNVPLGIISEKKLITQICSSNDLDNLLLEKVSQHMVTPPCILPQDALLETALKRVEKRNDTSLVVTAVTGELLGIVTPSDLAIAYSRIVQHHTENIKKTVNQRTEELEKVNRKLVTLSMVDSLTGLGNRRAMEVDIIRIHAACIRHHRPYVVVLFDIDYFKNYNDHYGHQAGDNILQMIANHFLKCVRESDSIYRYGGEEFLMIMPETTEEEAMVPIQRVIEGLASIEMPHVKSPFSYITTSAGIAGSCHKGQRLSNWRKVVELADDGLYTAKDAGRNQFAVSEASELKTIQ